MSLFGNIVKNFTGVDNKKAYEKMGKNSSEVARKAVPYVGAAAAGAAALYAAPLIATTAVAAAPILMPTALAVGGAFVGHETAKFAGENISNFAKGWFSA